MQAYRLPIRLPSYKNCLGLMLLCLLLTILDILVVETFYRPVCHTSEDWQIIWKWHVIYRFLIVMLPLLVAIKLRNITPLGTWLFFSFGLEDTLFYALQGYLPAQYPGISILGVWEPSLNLVLQINLLGLVTILFFTLSNLNHYLGARFLRLQRKHV
jgi:hypothetical protein